MAGVDEAAVEPFRERLVHDEAEELRDRIAAWAAEHQDELADTWPDMPVGIADRAADVWEPLIAIADRAGGDWPARARAAAVAINSARLERDPSLGVQLLADCRRLYAGHDSDRFTTEALVQALVALDESPWGDLRGKPIDARGIARRLKKYDVRPGDHRFDDKVLKGYRAEDFHDAWQRYLPAVAHVADVAPTAAHRGGNVARDTPAPIGSSTSQNGHGSASQEGQQGQHPLQAGSSSLDSGAAQAATIAALRALGNAEEEAV